MKKSNQDESVVEEAEIGPRRVQNGPVNPRPNLLAAYQVTPTGGRNPIFRVVSARCPKCKLPSVVRGEGPEAVIVHFGSDGLQFYHISCEEKINPAIPDEPKPVQITNTDSWLKTKMSGLWKSVRRKGADK